jgi:hypothetical protein
MESIRKMLMDSGIILAILTVLAYFTAYFHQYGYLGFYGIFNTDFIELGLVNVLSSFKSVLIMLFIMLSLYQLLLNTSMFFQDTSITGYAFMNYIIPWTMLAFIMAILFPTHNLKVLIFIVLFGFISTYFPGFVYFTEKGRKQGYKELLRLKFQRNQNDVINKENLKRKIKESPILIFVFAVFLLIFVQWYSSVQGNRDAQQQEHYLTLEIENKEFILVKKFNNNHGLLVSIDIKKKQLKKETLIVDLVKEGKIKQISIKDGLDSNYNSVVFFPFGN